MGRSPRLSGDMYHCTRYKPQKDSTLQVENCRGIAYLTSIILANINSTWIPISTVVVRYFHIADMATLRAIMRHLLLHMKGEKSPVDGRPLANLFADPLGGDCICKSGFVESLSSDDLEICWDGVGNAC